MHDLALPSSGRASGAGDACPFGLSLCSGAGGLYLGLPTRLDDAMAIGAIFTIISILRSFLLRRLFEAVRVGGQFRE